MKRLGILLILTGIFSWTACGKRPALEFSRPDQQFEAALAAFERGNYAAAAEGFKKLIFRFPGSDLVDDAQYYLAESYYRMRDYETALAEFQFLYTSFPRSEFRDDALLGMAQCYLAKSPRPELDQTDTHKAIQYAQRLLDEFPQSPLQDSAQAIVRQARAKLARKLLIAAETYEKLGALEAAELYLNVLLEEYGDTPVRLEALYHLAYVRSQEGKTREARQILMDLLSQDISPRLKIKTLVLLRKLPSL